MKTEVAKQLLNLGVARGGVLVVHTAFSKIAPIEGGPRGLIDALLQALGPDGTLVMPSMSDDDEHPFDPAHTPCAGMGITADTFWRMPGVLRSDSPHAFAAIGPKAAEITRPHPVDVPHGLDSPVGRIYELDGQVLLLGVGHDANTTMHLAENLAGVPYRIPKYATILVDGKPARRDYAEIDHCCENFAQMDDWLGGRQRRGIVGNGPARLVRSRDIVDAALQHLRANELVFLHPQGICGECDDARASIREETVGRASARPGRAEAVVDRAAILPNEVKTQYYTAASLDGFIADANNSLDWLLQFGPPEEGSYSAFNREVGAVALGSTTYQWALDNHVRLDSEKPEPWPSKQPTWVFTSRSLRTIPNADIRFVKGDVRPVHEEMVAAARGKNVWIMGGGDLAGQFYDAGLLDELIITIVPVTLGGGAPLLPRRIAQPPLQLTSVTRYGEFVELRYDVPRARA